MKSWMSEDPKKQRVAVITRYDVPSLNQRDLAAALDKELGHWISKRPGFVSGTVYRSIDGLHVILHTLWNREEDGINYRQCPEAKGLWEMLASSVHLVRNSHTYWVGEAIVPKRAL